MSRPLLILIVFLTQAKLPSSPFKLRKYEIYEARELRSVRLLSDINANILSLFTYTFSNNKWQYKTNYYFENTFLIDFGCKPSGNYGGTARSDPYLKD
jgi:hypothetical protein